MIATILGKSILGFCQLILRCKTICPALGFYLTLLDDYSDLYYHEFMFSIIYVFYTILAEFCKL